MYDDGGGLGAGRTARVVPCVGGSHAGDVQPASTQTDIHTRQVSLRGLIIAPRDITQYREYRYLPIQLRMVIYAWLARL